MSKSHEFIDELNSLPPLGLGTQILEKALEELGKISPERQTQLQREMRGTNGYPTHEWESGCGYHPE